MAKVIRVEQGWPAHLCVGSWCRFRRNTLLTCGRKRIVVSTVGAYYPPKHGEETGPITTIGCHRYYETMAFKAKKIEVYWEADVTKQVSFESPWSIDHHNPNADNEANKMHEAVVAELIRMMRGCQ